MQADVLVSSDQLQKRSRSLTEDEIFEAGCTLLALAARDKVVQVFYATVPFVRCLFGGGTLTKLPADGIVDADRRAGGFDEAEASDSDSLDEFDLPIGGKKGSAAPSKSKAQAAPPRAMQALVLPALEAFLGVVLIRASELNERTAKEARGVRRSFLFRSCHGRKSHLLRCATTDTIFHGVSNSNWGIAHHARLSFCFEEDQYGFKG